MTAAALAPAPAAAQEPADIATGWDARVSFVPQPLPARWPAAKTVAAVEGSDVAPQQLPAVTKGASPAAKAPSRTARRRSAVPLSGIASYYWQGVKTASGEPFNPKELTAAHPRLRFGTRVRVTHLGNGRSVVVRINDRGPFKAGRIIDLSEAAADAIGMKTAGLAKVRLDILDTTQQ
jgi:rare lipoprotein A (peptidoglycan hydrolase)